MSGHENYNYDTFELKKELQPFLNFQSAPNAGTQAPSFNLEDLASGKVVEMKDLWKKNLVILEFGSFT